jgi:rubrerythrin
MGLIDRALSLRPDTETIVECRRCGTTLSRGSSVCPVCESTDIAVYVIE